MVREYENAKQSLVEKILKLADCNAQAYKCSHNIRSTKTRIETSMKGGTVYMTIEVALLISGVSLAFGIYQGITNMRRNSKKDDQHDAAQLTTVIVKLENIGMGIAEIKSEMTNVKADIKESRERLIKVEQQVKVLNKTVFKGDVSNE